MERPAQTIVKAEKTVVPIVSVGALNPNGTDALFSNAGPWVRAHAQGASVMSTMPAFQGGLQPVARLELTAAPASRSIPTSTAGCRAVERRCSAALLFAAASLHGSWARIDPTNDGRGDAVPVAGRRWPR